MRGTLFYITLQFYVTLNFVHFRLIPETYYACFRYTVYDCTIGADVIFGLNMLETLIE